MRPWSRPRFRSRCLATSIGMLFDSMISRLISSTQSVPSGALTKVDGSEPIVGRTDEFCVFVGALRFKRRPVRNESPPVNQVVLRIADEHVAVELLG